MSVARSPYQTMIEPRLRVQTATHDPSDKENQDTPSQNMRKSARERKHPTRFEQPPVKTIHKKHLEIFNPKKANKAPICIIPSTERVRYHPLFIYPLVKTRRENRTQHLRPKNARGDNWDKVSYGKRLTEEKEVILTECCLANCVSYGQTGKVTEWWAQIKEDFYEESGRTYTGVQRKMEQLVKDRKKG